MDSSSPWLVFYTKARWEKKVYSNLGRFGFKAFLPLVKELHQWSDRKKKVEVPLFRSYIFVQTDFSKVEEVLKVPGIAWNIRMDSKPAVLRDTDKDLLEKALETGYQLTESLTENFEVGEEVEVTQGPLQGIKGRVLKGGNQQLLIRVESLDKSIKIQIPKDFLKK